MLFCWLWGQETERRGVPEARWWPQATFLIRFTDACESFFVMSKHRIPLPWRFQSLRAVLHTGRSYRLQMHWLNINILALSVAYEIKDKLMILDSRQLEAAACRMHGAPLAATHISLKGYTGPGRLRCEASRITRMFRDNLIQFYLHLSWQKGRSFSAWRIITVNNHFALNFSCSVGSWLLKASTKKEQHYPYH